MTKINRYLTETFPNYCCFYLRNGCYAIAGSDRMNVDEVCRTLETRFADTWKTMAGELLLNISFLRADTEVHGFPVERLINTLLISLDEAGQTTQENRNQTLSDSIQAINEKLDVRRCLSPIHALGATDIAITGAGVIDGNGDAWREVKKRKVSPDLWKTVLRRGGVLSEDGSVWYPDEGYRKARLTAGSLNRQDPSLDEQEILTFLRPVMVSLRECERVLIEGCTFQNSPCWNLHPLYCKDLTVRNIQVRNPYYSTNGDGIDIDACENVRLSGSTFDVGDDAICLKSGKDEDGRRHGRKCRNVVIEDCTVYHGHGGFVVGSEMSGGVENVLVRRCRFLGTDVGLRFKSTRGRGGLVKDIWCDHIYMKDIVADAVIFNLYYAGVAATDRTGAATEDLVPVDETTPRMEDIHFSDIVCSGAARAVSITGLPELPLRRLGFRDCTFQAEEGVRVVNAEEVSFDNVTVNGEKL